MRNLEVGDVVITNEPDVVFIHAIWRVGDVIKYGVSPEAVESTPSENPEDLTYLTTDEFIQPLSIHELGFIKEVLAFGVDEVEDLITGALFTTWMYYNS